MQRSVDQSQTFMETTKQSLEKSCWILPRCTAVAHGQYTKNTSDKAVLEKTACHQLTHCSDPRDRINQTNCVYMRPCGCGSHCNKNFAKPRRRCFATCPLSLVSRVVFLCLDVQMTVVSGGGITPHGSLRMERNVRMNLSGTSPAATGNNETHLHVGRGWDC